VTSVPHNFTATSVGTLDDRDSDRLVQSCQEKQGRVWPVPMSDRRINMPKGSLAIDGTKTREIPFRYDRIPSIYATSCWTAGRLFGAVRSVQ